MAIRARRRKIKLINYELGNINEENRQSNNRLYNIIIRLNPTYNININSFFKKFK